MPYTIRKRKCKQSDGDSGSYVLSYKDKKGKKHRACHTSRKKARGQIAAIEAEGIERNKTMKITLSNLRQIIQEEILDEVKTIAQFPDVYRTAIEAQNTLDDKTFIQLFEKLKSAILASSGPFEIPEPRLVGLFDEIKTLNPADDTNRAREIVEELTATTGAGMRGQVAGASGKYDPRSVDALLSGLPTPVGSNVTFKSIASNESLQSLKALIQEIVLEEAKKSKAKKSKAKKGRDMDADGDIDAADYKTKVYMAGGVPKGKALKMSRKFDGK